VFILRNKARKI